MAISEHRILIPLRFTISLFVCLLLLVFTFANGLSRVDALPENTTNSFQSLSTDAVPFPGWAYPIDSTLDSNDNLYSFGIRSGIINFDTDGNTINPIEFQGQRLFLSKHNDTNDYQWTLAFDVESSYSGDGVLAVDSQDNVYFAIQFQGTFDFDPTQNFDMKSSGTSVEDVGFRPAIAVTRVNANGTYGWTRVLGDNIAQNQLTGGLSEPNSLNVDSNGNIYIGASFQNQVNFGSDAFPDIHQTVYATDPSITRINADGTYGWTRTWTNGLSSQSDSVLQSRIYNDKLYLLIDNPPNGPDSSWNGTLMQDLGPIDLDPTSGTDIQQVTFTYISVLNLDGSYNEGISLPTSQARDFNIDSNGTIYLTGLSYNSIRNFNPEGGMDTQPCETGNDPRAFCAYISSLNSDLTYRWTRTWPISTDFNQLQYMESVPIEISFDLLDNLIISGAFYGDTDLDLTSNTAIHFAAFEVDSYLFSLDSSGGYLWSKTWDEILQNTDVTSTGEIAAFGSFQGTVDFDPSIEEFFLTSYPNTIAFYSFLDSLGDFVEAKTFGPIYEAPKTEKLGTLENSLNIKYGNFQSTFDFDPGIDEDIRTCGNGDCQYVSIYDSATYLVTYHFFPNEFFTGTTTFQTQDLNGNTWTAGFINAATDLDPTGGIDTAPCSAYCSYLTKISSTNEYMGSSVFTYGPGAFGISLGLYSSGNDIVQVGLFAGTITDSQNDSQVCSTGMCLFVNEILPTQNAPTTTTTTAWNPVTTNSVAPTTTSPSTPTIPGITTLPKTTTTKKSGTLTPQTIPPISLPEIPGGITTPTTPTSIPSFDTSNPDGTASSDNLSNNEVDQPWLILGNFSVTGSNIWDMVLLAIFILFLGIGITYVLRETRKNKSLENRY